MKQDTYYIMYSSSSQYAVHTKVHGKDMCIKSGMTEERAIRLKQAMILNVENRLVHREYQEK